MLYGAWLHVCRYASQRVLAPILFTLLVIVSWWTLLNMFVSILADECAPPTSALGLDSPLQRLYSDWADPCRIRTDEYTLSGSAARPMLWSEPMLRRLCASSTQG